MREALQHEASYRGGAVLTQIAALPVTICGAGALGANLALTLARQGFGQLTVIDQDRVEASNLGTQPYLMGDIGGRKAEALSNIVFQAIGLEITAVAKTLTGRNAKKLLRGSGLVIDCFDNTAARQAVQDTCRASHLPCLHVGLSADYAEVIWDSTYRVPSDAGLDLCEYPLARNLVQIAVGIAAEVIVGFVAKDEHRSFTLTLRDLSIRAYNASIHRPKRSMVSAGS